MILQLLINVLTGAGTGYITNNIAIKMLFKKYFGRFGGIIEDTHDEFVDNISKLIEKDLINHHTLEDEFVSENFRNYIKELIKDMFIYSLPQHSINLKDVRGIHESTQNLVTFLDENHHFIDMLKRSIATKPLKDALSYGQLLTLCKPIAHVVNTQKDDYLNSIVPVLKEFKIDALLTEELLLQLTKNIETIIHNIDIAKYNEPIDDFVAKLFYNIDLDSILKGVALEIENISFKQIFAKNQNATKELLGKLLEIALSPKGQVAIKESVSAVLETLSRVDVSILSLLNEEIKESIKSFIREELPNIINKIIEFMDQNEKDLEDLINGAIDKALDGGIFSELKKKVVSIFYTNIVADFKVLTMVKEYIHTYKGKVEEEVVAQVIDILENRSIGELYSAIANKKIISPQKVFLLIVHNLKQFNPNNNIHILDALMKKQVKDYTKVDITFLRDDLIPHTISKLKSEYLYKETFKQFITKETSKIIDSFKDKTINEIFGDRVDIISQKISHTVDKDKILNTILLNGATLLDKPIKESINVDEFTINYKYYIDEIVNGNSIKDIIIHMQSEDVYIAVESALIKVVVDNLEEILKDNVSEAVKKELAKLPPSQIKDMVEEFMGEELKPINYFGAVLGGGAGAVVGAISIPVWANPFIYGVVGIATNYLAIKMLFQPYYPLKIAQFKVPFTEGVLPSNKEKMATKMSEFVDEFMLNGTSIQDFFKHNSEHLKDFIKGHISQDDYAIIDTLIHQKSNMHELSHEATNLIFNFLDNNHELIAKKIFTITMELYDKRENYADKAEDIIYKELMRRDFKEFAYKQFEKYLDEESSLDFVKDDIFLQLDTFIEKTLQHLLDVLFDPTKLQEIMLSFDKQFTHYTETKTLNDTIDKELKKKISEKAGGSLISLFYGEESINDMLSFFTKGEFGADSKLSDMINGMLPKIIEKNLKLIIDDSILPTLREHKRLIRAEIMQIVPFGVRWAVKRDVNRAINIILDDEIPQFLDVKIQQINTIVQDVLRTQLIDLGYTKDVINQEKVDALTKSILYDKNFKQSFAFAMNTFLDNIFEMKIQTLLQIFNITKLSEIYDMFAPNINRVAKIVHKNMQKNQKDIVDNTKILVKDIIGVDLFHSLKIKDILKDIDTDMLLREFEYLEKNLKKSQKFQQSIKIILAKFIKSFMKEEFLDKKIFKDDLDKFLKDIIRDKEQLREILIPFLQEFILNINKILDLKLKDNMLEIITDAAFLSIDKKIDILMGAVDFKKVITKEIQEMHPKELEDMFYSFAGPYFNKLILYGSLGFFFGLITLIQV